MDVKKVPNWRNLVRILKEGPDFGIHGTKFEKAQKILLDGDTWVLAHYFCVGENQKKLPDVEFYEKLWASIGIAYHFSECMDVNKKELTFIRNPCLVLGINRNEDRCSLEDRSLPGASVYGSKGETFPIGHDFYKFAGIEVKSIYIDDSGIGDIQRKLAQYSAKPKVYSCLYPDISHAYFVEREIIGRFVKTLPNALKSDKQSLKQ